VKRTLRNYPYSSKYLLLRSAEKKIHTGLEQ